MTTILVDEHQQEPLLNGINSILKQKIFLADGAAPGNQPFEAEIASLLIYQVLIPILVSLTSKTIYDVLRDKTLSKLRKKEAESIVKSLLKEPIQPDAPLQDHCLDELATQLKLYGLSKVETLEIYEQIRVRIIQARVQGE
jgi:hypothetical protein